MEMNQGLIEYIKTQAQDSAAFTGPETLENMKTLLRCTHVDKANGIILVFTRDESLTNLWRCYHLSLSFFDQQHDRIPQDRETAKAWGNALFGEENLPYVLIQRPVLPIHAAWHYFVFCDEAWKPITEQEEIRTIQIISGYRTWLEIEGNTLC